MARQGKIGVLTFHRCINYGSFWQARCIVEGLRQMGWNAVLLDHRSSRVNQAEWACALRPLLPARTPRADIRQYAAKTRKFFDGFDSLPLSAPFPLDDPRSMEACDAVVVGSDEVWNFRHPWYAGCPLFFGEGLKTDRLVAYAASFGNHDAGHGMATPWARRLERFSAIAVRDDNSRELIRVGLGQDPDLVLDPCLLFEELCRRPARTAVEADRPGGSLVVYGHSFSEAFGRTVRAWAGSRGLRLVSLGYRNDWADEQRLAAGPDEFAQAMADAKAVVTNFFHGCVFALVNRKPFAGVLSDYRTHKVTALARSLGADDRLVHGEPADGDLDRALGKPLEPLISDRILASRRRSRAYLERALDA